MFFYAWDCKVHEGSLTEVRIQFKLVVWQHFQHFFFSIFFIDSEHGFYTTCCLLFSFLKWKNNWFVYKKKKKFGIQNNSKLFNPYHVLLRAKPFWTSCHASVCYSQNKTIARKFLICSNNMYIQAKKQLNY